MENATQKLAERIANFLQNGESAAANDFAALQKSIEQINERLFKIENNLTAQTSPKTSDSPSFHPSREKFGIAEAFAAHHTGALSQHSETEKPCPFEPTGKPCDHCSMCNSRGF